MECVGSESSSALVVKVAVVAGVLLAVVAGVLLATLLPLLHIVVVVHYHHHDWDYYQLPLPTVQQWQQQWR
jgi:energy-converting hydrogenase Eha subunit A